MCWLSQGLLISVRAGSGRGLVDAPSQCTLGLRMADLVAASALLADKPEARRHPSQVTFALPCLSNEADPRPFRRADEVNGGGPVFAAVVEDEAGGQRQRDAPRFLRTMVASLASQLPSRSEASACSPRPLP